MNDPLENVEVEPVIEEARGAENVAAPPANNRNRRRQDSDSGSSSDSPDESYAKRMRNYADERPAIREYRLDNLEEVLRRGNEHLARQIVVPGDDELDDDEGEIEGARLIRDDVEQPVAAAQRPQSPNNGIPGEQLFHPQPVHRIFDEIDDDQELERDRANRARLLADHAAPEQYAEAMEVAPHVRRGPRTPPLEPGMIPIAGEPGYVPPEEEIDPELGRPRIGPRTPPEEDYREPSPDDYEQEQRGFQYGFSNEQMAEIQEQQRRILEDTEREILESGPLSPGHQAIYDDLLRQKAELEEKRRIEIEAQQRLMEHPTPPQEQLLRGPTDEFENREVQPEMGIQQQEEPIVPRRGPRTPDSSPPPTSHGSSPADIRDISLSPPPPREDRKRRSGSASFSDATYDDDEAERELAHPMVVTQKALSLLEFVEKKGLTINDNEMLQVVRDALVLDNAMETICEKKEILKKQMDELAQWELEEIRNIHANMPRHMQDVLTFDGSTVTIAEERPTMPPFATASTLMSLKYGQSLAQQMGLPPAGVGSSSYTATQHAAMSASALGLSSMGATSHFGSSSSGSLLGPAPFGMPPLIPQPPPTSSIQMPARSSSQRSAGILVQPMEPPGPLQGLNPLAFANAPPGLQLAPMPEYSRPLPAKKAATQQNPQMNRVSNNLSNMLTNALKAQVSKSQSSFGGQPSTPKKGNVPSLMSINIPGVPKPP